MHFIKYLLVSALSSIVTNAYALDHIPVKIHHPIQIKKTPSYMLLTPNGLTPQQIKTVYGLTTVPGQGDGQIIAIVDAYDHPSIEADLATFSSTFNLPACNSANNCFQKIYADGTLPAVDKDWAGEIALDVEWAHAIAPGAKIYLIETKTDNPDDLYKGIQVAVANGANVVSLSWGSPEGDWVKIFNMDQYFDVPNVTFVASSGDYGHQVNYPASSPFVIGVGGTSLRISPTTGKRLSETAWAGSGGGLSTIEAASVAQAAYVLPNNPGQMRGVPDVSSNADPNSGYAVYNSVPNPHTGDTGWFIVGGTSAVAPQWSAIVAIANSMAKRNIPVNKLLYDIANKNYRMSYYDITSGQNGTCGYFCQTQLGYDYVTGLGSPHARYIINQLIHLS